MLKNQNKGSILFDDVIASRQNSVSLILSGITGQGVAQMLTTGQIPERFRPFTLQRFAEG
ncbi:MAG TPA: hypothetical protein VFV38_50160 [Ktedonobacteraceae bacterium]|nr:hypothetical protein [Ktedonobacteraceae bacterium]